MTRFTWTRSVARDRDRTSAPAHLDSWRPRREPAGRVARQPEPAPRTIGFGLDDPEAAHAFERLAARLRDWLRPQGELEELLLARLALATWRLERSTAFEATPVVADALDAIERAQADRYGRPHDADPAGAASREAAAAERSVLTTLRAIREARALAAPPAPEVQPEPVAPPIPADAVADFVPMDDHIPAPPAAPASTGWRGHLAFDFALCPTGPVVRGTAIPAARVEELVRHGWSVAELIRSYPALTPGAIRACVEYVRVHRDDDDGL